MPRMVFEEEMCCGYKKCPTVRCYEDGSVEITDNDSESGSVGTIRLQPAVAVRLAALIHQSRP
jgi:hypothetical protein